MEKEKLEALLIEYIDGNLSQAECQEVENLMKASKETNDLYKELSEVITLMKNSESLKSVVGHEKNFEHKLNVEIAASSRSKFIRFHPIVYRVAAAVALVMVGLATGYWINKNNQHEKELAALRVEMAATKQLMMAMLTNEQSASQRMQGVNVAFTMSDADDDVVDALANTMITDPNTNVRLAALEALSQFADELKVRKLLVSSLSQQHDPVVQISLIQLLVRIKEDNVVNELEKIVDDDNNIKAVKDEAYIGILKLS